MKVKMIFISPNVFYFLLFILIDVAVKSQMSSNSNSHAFIQDNNENVRYIVDSIPISMHKEFSSSSTGVNLLCTVQKVEESTNFNSKAHLKFEPNLLDFRQRALGVPHHEKVTIINLHANKTLHMSSISGNTVHFHSSFFEDKVIPPLGNTSFNVVFLGREEGEIESSLYIHTSEGSFKYQVKGSSVQSPYRLRPLYGVRLPLNATFSPLIHMHNPYNAPLQLVEVYSSGGEFHLELPGGELEGPRHLWEIPAFLTKPVIRVRFQARTHKNHTAYIRFKVSQSEEVLVVPLEVEVGSACGLYATEDAIDFGLGGSDDPPKTLKLFLRNSFKKPIKIQNVISTPVSKALRIEFEPVKVPAESEEDTEVARLTFDWGAALETGHTSGRIVVKGKQSSQRLVLPYTASVLAGGLSYNAETTRFRSVATDAPPPPRNFRLTNNFKIPVAITNVSLPHEAQPYFQVKEFVPGILSPSQTVDLFQISPLLSPQLTLDTVITVWTNVSQLSVPLLCYNGKLTKVIPPRNESQLELGTVGSGTEKQVVFALVNENPVPVTIKSWQSSLANFAVTIAAIRDDSVANFLTQPHHTLYNLTTKERRVGPGQYVVVSVKVQAGTQLGDTLAHLSLQTDYELVQIPAHMRVEHGSLQVTPDPVLFNDCFPGKVCSESLRVQSLFSVAMAVTAVNGGDSPLSFLPSSPSLLLPASTSTLGVLTYDTRQLPPEDNYLNITHNITGRWQDTVELAAHWADYDLGLLAARYDHYLNLSSRLINLTLRLDTTEVREHEFGARVRLGWPRLSDHLSIPLTQVGHSTKHPLTVTNPSTHQPLLVQLLLENSYPSSVVHNMPSGLKPELAAEAQEAGTEFTIDTQNSEHKLSGNSHRDSWLFLLPPSSNTTVTVNFSPTNSQLSATHLLLRNNLTVLEAVRLSGSGAFTQFKFGNRKPGSSTPLLFELVEKHLKDCEREKQRKLPAPNLTVKRSFTARNTGALPIMVRGFDISGLACEGYGFRVLNCEPFDLPPNATRKVDIAFTPDLTLARVQRTLGVWTSDSDSVANYTLVATLPPFLLSSCSAVLARPTWEPLLYYSAIIFMVFLLICVLSAAFLESDRALKCALLAMSRDNATVQPVLDLKSIGTGVGLGAAEVPQHAASITPPSTAPLEPPVHEVKERDNVGTTAAVSAGLSTPASSAATAYKYSKKKEKEKTVVNKRLSDSSDGTLLEQQSTWTNVFTKPVTSTLPKPQQKPVISTVEATKLPQNTEGKRKLSKKNSNPGRSVREVPTLPLPSSNNNEDTETSSTTTESSHDDGDKEVETTLTIVGNKSVRGARGKPAVEGRKSGGVDEGNNGSASSLELEWDDDKQPINPRPRKSNTKSGKTTESGHGGGSGRTKSSSGSGKQTNTRVKDKQPLALRKSADKLPSLPKPIVQEPPPPPMSMWDESRASFSDVVARSDASKQTTQPLPPLHTAPTPLGPIGSKKTYSTVWDWDSDLNLAAVPPSPAPPQPAISHPTPLPLPSHPSHQPSSFFMHSRPSSTLQNASSWEPTLLLKMLQEEQRRLEVETRPRPSYQVSETWSPWEPMVEVPPCPPAPPHPAPWGSDVWAPPPPDTWAPPGLAPRPPPRLDEPTNPQIDQVMEYDPFRSLSNIWSPHSSSIWKPPTTNNN